MAGYTPLFGEIVSSSIWNEDAYTCKVWVTMLALADKDGNVYGSVAGFAPICRVTLEQCEKAFNILISADKYSRTKTFEGRRIKEINGGWHIINHSKYRKRAKSRAEYFRKYRETKKEEEIQTQTQTQTQTGATPAQHFATCCIFTIQDCKDACI